MDNPLLILLFIVIILVIAVLAIGWLAQQGKRLQAEQSAQLARSQAAQAKILQVGKSVAQVRNGTVVVKLRMEVRPADSSPYPVTTVWEVQQAALAQLQPEQVVAVKIDPDDAQRIYPNVGWAEFSATYWRAWVQAKQQRRAENNDR